ncbi:MAG: patatin-like phospholipase family protein [Pseudomonadota bacterium]
MSKPIVILAIDGGGVRGLIPALLLKALSDQIATHGGSARGAAKPLGRYFDLIAGTSTGALIAVGLSFAKSRGSNVPLATPEELVAFYRERSAHAFRRIRFQKLRRLWRSEYNYEPFASVLEDIVGERRLSETTTPVVLPAYDVHNRYVRYFNSDAASTSDGEDYYLRDVLRATTAAPVYFPPARISAIGGKTEEVFVDGGLFANNPSLCASTEALRQFGFNRQLIVVSMGTGQANQRYPLHRLESWGAFKWLDPRMRMPLIDVMMDGQTDATHHHLNQVLKPDETYFRFDPALEPGLVALDDASSTILGKLDALAQMYIESQMDRLRRLARLLTEHKP